MLCGGMEIAVVLMSNKLFIKTKTMKKLFFVIFAMTLSGAIIMTCSGTVMANTGPGDWKIERDRARERDYKTLKADVRVNNVARHQVSHDWGHFRISKAFRDHHAVRETNKVMYADSKKLKDEGVNHPVTKARMQVKVEDQNMKDHI
jgi:hypothetical protein